jgi:hypothetical protein
VEKAYEGSLLLCLAKSYPCHCLTKSYRTNNRPEPGTAALFGKSGKSIARAEQPASKRSQQKRARGLARLRGAERANGMGTILRDTTVDSAAASPLQCCHQTRVTSNNKCERGPFLTHFAVHLCSFHGALCPDVSELRTRESTKHVGHFSLVILLC